MGIAGVVNISMLLVAAALFHGVTDIDSIEGAYDGFRDQVGDGAAIAFGVALLASGPVELERRHLRRPGRHAGLHPPLGPAAGCAA